MDATDISHKRITMELYQLRTFITVAKEGHLTRAAERLFTSQPAVSAHIKALEEELELTLFVRSKKGMTLTNEGRYILCHAEQTMAAAAGLSNMAKSLQKELVGQVKIALNTDLELLNVAELFSLIKEAYPRLELHLIQSSSTRILNYIRKGVFDGGYIFGENRFPDVTALKLGKANLVIAGPAKWKEKMENAGWEEIVALPWIWQSQECPCEKYLSVIFKQYDIAPNKAVIADDEATMKMLLMSGAGLALIDENEAHIAEKEGRVHIWPHARIDVDLSFAYLRSREKDPVIQAVKKCLEKIWGPLNVLSRAGENEATGAKAPLKFAKTP